MPEPGLSTRAIERTGTRHLIRMFNYHLPFPFPFRTRSTSIIPVANHPWVAHLSTTFNPLMSIASVYSLSLLCCFFRLALARRVFQLVLYFVVVCSMPLCSVVVGDAISCCIWMSIHLLYAVSFSVDGDAISQLMVYLAVIYCILLWCCKSKRSWALDTC